MTHEDIVKLLKEKQGNTPTRQFARDLNVSRTYLYNVYNGTEPGAKILAALDLEVDKVVVTYKPRRWR